MVETIVTPTDPLLACTDPQLLWSCQNPEVARSAIATPCVNSDPVRAFPNGSRLPAVYISATLSYIRFRFCDHIYQQLRRSQLAENLCDGVERRLAVGLQVDGLLAGISFVYLIHQQMNIDG